MPAGAALQPAASRLWNEGLRSSAGRCARRRCGWVRTGDGAMNSMSMSDLCVQVGAERRRGGKAKVCELDKAAPGPATSSWHSPNLSARALMQSEWQICSDRILVCAMLPLYTRDTQGLHVYIDEFLAWQSQPQIHIRRSRAGGGSAGPPAPCGGCRWTRPS